MILLIASGILNRNYHDKNYPPIKLMLRIFKFKRNVFGIKKKKLCFAKHCVLKIVIQELQSKQVTNTISKINYFFVI